MGAFFTVFAALFVVSTQIERFRGLVAMAALLFLVSALLVYTKYVSVDFYYDIMNDESGEGLFVVRQTVGRRSITLCRISLSDIVKIEKESREQRKAHKTERGVAKYFYTPTLSPSVSYRIFAKNRHESSEIIVEGSDEFIAMLTELSQNQVKSNEEE